MRGSAIVAIWLHLAAVAATTLAFALKRPPPPPRLAGYSGPIYWLGRWAYWATKWILERATAWGVTANGMTWIGVALTVAAAGFSAAGAWGWAWVMLLWGATGDLLDGQLARNTGTQSKAGAFLDSNLDRMSEIVFFAGVARGLGDPSGVAWAGAAMAASLMVSYARARGEGLGVDCPQFGLERPHRVVIFLFVLLGAAFLSPAAAALLVEAACAVVALGAGGTAVGRMVVIHRMLVRAQAPAQPPAVTAPKAPPAAKPAVASGEPSAGPR